VGIALYPAHGRTVPDLVQAAYAAMEQAQQQGGARWRVHDPKDPERRRSGDMREQTVRIREAIEEQRFVPVFQPVQEITSGRIVSAETLARLRERDGTLQTPDQFLAAAERFGLVTAIDRLLIASTFEHVSAARSRLAPDFEIAINLSGIDFEDDKLVGDISHMARRKGIRPDRVTFEITETAALRDLPRVQSFTQALVAEGFRFALDDFGIGYSSFRYLRELPVSVLKFDVSYVQNLPIQAENRVFVRGIAEICRGLGVKTVAEGVESATVLNILRELGVDRAQGHYIGRPVPDLPDNRMSGTFRKVTIP
jgi:EAL domain-containing protein (putative c-di-GMP-specific phosphodiesterase class I)